MIHTSGQSNICIFIVCKQILFDEGSGVLYSVSQCYERRHKHIKRSKSTPTLHLHWTNRCLEMLLYVCNPHLGEGRGALVIQKLWSEVRAIWQSFEADI